MATPRDSNRLLSLSEMTTVPKQLCVNSMPGQPLKRDLLSLIKSQHLSTTPFRKVPRARKNKIGTPPPPPKDLKYLASA